MPHNIKPICNGNHVSDRLSVYLIYATVTHHPRRILHYPVETVLSRCVAYAD
jgi:hypothetical protein